MEMQEKIRTTREQIWTAIHDYGAHTSQKRVLDDISSCFVDRLAEDSVKAKQPLREMFRKSPAWDENLDALVINGTRTHEPDYDRIFDLGLEILRPAIYQRDGSVIDGSAIREAIRFFSNPDADEEKRQAFLTALNKLAPKAYAPGKKLSRVFKALCKELGVVDETAGSSFQRLYAQFADELSAKKLPFKLFVSLNPAHFVTMSNPKNDKRGSTLTSCHSFNQTEYSYNCGCSGYACDDVTMIAFTAADPSVPETLNNRKTTRQLFMYKPGNGLLLQSRMYNTSGGTSGAQAESEVYRHLIQREISECEDMPNLWLPPMSYYENKNAIYIPTGEGFGGYADWPHEEFAAVISIRKDHVRDYRTFAVGTYGLCISCGDEISSHLYCDCCSGNEDGHTCAECGDYFDDEDDLHGVYNSHGELIRVCESCRDNYYSYCECCNDYYPNDYVSSSGDDEYVCDDCRGRYYETCDSCGDFYHRDNIYTAVDCNGHEVHICHDCRDDYETCDHCERYVNSADAIRAYSDGNEETVCPACAAADYSECDECGEWHRDGDMTDGLCPNCYAEKEENEKEAVSA